jgi:hypothetical protein
MDNVINAIRAAVAADATPEARAAGVQACQATLAALQATPGETFQSTPRIEVGPTAAAVAAIVRSIPPDQLLDLAIAKLRSMVPAESGPPQARPFNVRLVPVPRR